MAFLERVNVDIVDQRGSAVGLDAASGQAVLIVLLTCVVTIVTLIVAGVGRALEFAVALRQVEVSSRVGYTLVVLGTRCSQAGIQLRFATCLAITSRVTAVSLARASASGNCHRLVQCDIANADGEYQHYDPGRA